MCSVCQKIRTIWDFFPLTIYTKFGADVICKKQRIQKSHVAC